MKTKLFTLILALAFFSQPGMAKAQDKTYTNSIGMELVLMQAGSFMMGSEKGLDDEKPVHKVTISQPFYIGKYPVTQAQWVAVMGSNPSVIKGRDNPVENVSWNDVQDFIIKLNANEGHSRYSLPTEAEWEYAARAGTSSEFFFGDDEKELSKYGWYEGNSRNTTHPVGQKLPNAWGLYDVHGNVCEWVQGWMGDYSSAAVTDPKGPPSGSYRVYRGGSWYNTAEFCRSASRYYNSPDVRVDDLGFRLALSPGQ